MLAIRKGGTCDPDSSAFIRLREAARLAAANRAMNTLSRGFLSVALTASATTRSTPFVK